MPVWVTWYSQWQKHNRMAKLRCLVSSVKSVYLPERYSVYKCVTCLHGATFLAFKIQCVAMATLTGYILILCHFPCSSVTPGYLPQWSIVTLDKQMMRYVNTLSCLIQLQQVKSVSISAAMFHRAYTEAVQTYYRHSMQLRQIHGNALHTIRQHSSAVYVGMVGAFILSPCLPGLRITAGQHVCVTK